MIEMYKKHVLGVSCSFSQQESGLGGGGCASRQFLGGGGEKGFGLVSDENTNIFRFNDSPPKKKKNLVENTNFMSQIIQEYEGGRAPVDCLKDRKI